MAIDQLCAAVAEAATANPPPQVLVPGSPAAALAQTLPPTLELHRYGLILAYSRVNYVLHITRLAARLFQNNPFSYAAADLARNALEIGLRNAWIFNTPDHHIMLARMAGDFSQSVPMSALRTQFIAAFTDQPVTPTPMLTDTAWIRGQIDLLGMDSVENADSGRWKSFAGEPESPNLTGNKGTPGIAEQLNPIYATRYRYLSGFTHGLADQMSGRTDVANLDDAATRGKIGVNVDFQTLIGIYGSFADSCSLAAAGLYEHLGWNIDGITAAANELTGAAKQLMLDMSSVQ